MIIKAKCITDNCSDLTKGKIYDVNYDFIDYIVITNDLGNRKKYPLKYFKDLTNKEDNSMKCCANCKYKVSSDCTCTEICINYSMFEPKQKEINSDKINPSYYGTGLDVIDFCQKNNLDFMQGNVIKYVTRYKEKNGKEDLLKAREYIDRIIKEKYKEM